jgi:TATA-box binding protein (TBP) (component of TFIID and TFIIIB)
LIFKCQSQEGAQNAITLLLKEIDNIALECAPVICNMVGMVDLGMSLNLGVLSKLIPKAEYEPDLHVSLFASIGTMKATTTNTGKAMLFGARSLRQFEEGVRCLFDIGCKYKESKNGILR